MFWVLDNNPEINRYHKFVFYMIVFRGFDAEAIYKQVETMENVDNSSAQKIKKGRVNEPDVSYDLLVRDKNGKYLKEDSIEKIKGTYQEIRDLVSISGEVLIEKFLQDVNFKADDSASLINDYSDFLERKRSIEDLQNEVNGSKAVLSEDVHRLTLSAIKVPDNEMDMILEECLILQAQRGSLTARNKLLVSILRLVRYIARRGKARYYVEVKKIISPEEYNDIEQELALLVLEKVVTIDPRHSKATTRLGRWCEGYLEQMVFDLEVVKRPKGFRDVVALLLTHPDLPDKQIANMYGVTLSSIRRARMGLGSNRAISLDSRLQSKSGEGCTYHEFLVEAATPAFEDAIVNKLTNFGLRQIISTLPPRDKMLLKARIYEELTLKEIGARYGFGQENIRRLLDNIYDNLRGMGEDGEILNPGQRKNQYIYMIVDEAGFENWCNENVFYVTAERFGGLSLPYLLKCKMRLFEDDMFGDFGAKKIEKYLNKQRDQGVEFSTSPNKVSSLLRVMLEKLVDAMKELPVDERCVLVTTEREIYRAANKKLHQLTLRDAEGN